MDLLKKEIKHALKIVSDMEKEGIDMKFFMEQLVEMLHAEMVLQIMNGKDGEFSVEELKRLIELLANAHQELKYAVIPQLPLELAIVEYTVVVLPHAGGAARQTESISSEKPSSLSEGLPKNSIEKKSVGRPSVAPQVDKPAPTFLDELIAKV